MSGRYYIDPNTLMAHDTLVKRAPIACELLDRELPWHWRARLAMAGALRALRRRLGLDAR